MILLNTNRLYINRKAAWALALHCIYSKIATTKGYSQY